jgi:adenylylsulfate reductase subunit A
MPGYAPTAFVSVHVCPAGCVSALYMTNGKLLERGLELLAMMKEDMAHMGAEDLHQLQRTRESVTQHTLYREETRWPGYYYRGNHVKLDDANWRCFTLSRYDCNTGKSAMGKGAGLPHHRLTRL